MSVSAGPAPRPPSGPAAPPAAHSADGSPIERLSLRSADVDEVRSFGGRYFYPRRFLHPLQRSGRLAARFDLIRLGPLTIGDCRYGAEITLAYEHPDAYQIGVPLTGRLETHQGGRAILSAGRLAGLFRVGEGVVINRWSADCRQLGVKINRGFLEGQLQTLLDAPTEVPLKFSNQLDISTGRGLSWARLIRLVADEIGNDGGLLEHPLIVAHLCESVTLGLLLATEHPYREALTSTGRAYRPAPVRRAIDAIQAHPEHPFTLAALAQIAGISARSLQAGFRRYVGYTPMAYLRHVRLARAHAELRVADPRQTTVAEVAYRWGFAHLGRFAALYRQAYGESPAATLRRPPLA